MVITGLSVAVALLIGTQEIISISPTNSTFHDGFLGTIGNLDLGAMGFIIVGLLSPPG